MLVLFGLSFMVLSLGWSVAVAGFSLVDLMDGHIICVDGFAKWGARTTEVNPTYSTSSLQDKVVVI
jgi:hypothetical protein